MWQKVQKKTGLLQKTQALAGLSCRFGRVGSSHVAPLMLKDAAVHTTLGKVMADSNRFKLVSLCLFIINDFIIS